MNINLKAERVNRGLGLQEAADAIGVPRNTLIQAELGKRVPQPPNAFKIASFFGYKVTDIWPVEDPIPPVAA